MGINWSVIIQFESCIKPSSDEYKPGQIDELKKKQKMNLKLFITALLATGANAAWTAEDFDALSEAIRNELLESHSKEVNVQRRWFWLRGLCC